MVLLPSSLSRPPTLKANASSRVRRDGTGAELARRRQQSRSTPALGDARALHITATPLAPPAPYAYTPPPQPPPLPPEPESAVDSFLVLEGSNKAALAAAAFAAAAEQNEAVLNALRRKELNEIHERIQAALDVFETEETFDGGGGSGDDDDSEDGGGGGEGASAEALEAAKEKLMVMLLEYKTTCSSRRAVLGQMDAGLAKLVEIAADGGGGGAAAATPRDDDAEVEALVEAAESAAVGEMAEGMRGQQAQLNALHGEQISLPRSRARS